jgi:Family of unknown function (DUF5372)
VGAYGEALEEHLQDLAGRLKRGAYRAKPVRRAYIPKADGRQRRWASRRSRHTAASSRIASDSLIVVHPFHPLVGQRLPVLFERHLAAGRVYICEGGSLGTVTLPEDFTDRGLPPATRPLTAEVLAVLAATLSALKRKP